MNESFYTVRAEVRKVRGVHRRARLPTGHEVDFGVHGSIKEHYRLEGEDLPLPVDYLVAGAGA